MGQLGTRRGGWLKACILPCIGGKMGVRARNAGKGGGMKKYGVQRETLGCRRWGRIGK